MLYLFLALTNRRHYKFLCSLFVISVWIVFSVFAQPKINFVEANLLKDGNVVKITGENFGSFDGEILLWDNFESGSANDYLYANPLQGTWQLNNYPRAIYSMEDSHSGYLSAYALRDSSHQWSNFNVLFQPARKFYQSFWFKYSYPEGDVGQTKIVQVHGDCHCGDFAPGVMTGGFAGDWWASYISTETNHLYQQNYYTAPPSMNEWHHFESILLESSEGSVPDGYVEFKIDGYDVYKQENVITRDDSAYHWSMIEFFTGMTNFNANSETFIDDCYLANAWNRVEIGDRAAYDNCSHREIQPIVQWLDNSISIIFNQGSFQEGEQVYLFVVDVNGNISNGFPIKIGSHGPLLRCLWDLGTGTDTNVIRGGIFTSGGYVSDEPSKCWEVYQDGIGNLNYLRIYSPLSRSGWIYGHDSFNSPSHLYVSLWMRFNADFPNTIYHPFVLGPIQQPLTGNAIYFLRFAPGMDGEITWSLSNYRRWNVHINDGEWYFMEFLFINDEGSADSIYVRINGEDVTASYERETIGGLISLAQDNGSLDLPDLNYIALESYDNPAGHIVLDVADLRVMSIASWLDENFSCDSGETCPGFPECCLSNSNKDINQDGAVNVDDIQLIVNVILGNAANSRADVNGDGSVTITDVQTVVSDMLG